ncbi:related to fusarubin cluster-esterase [Phialocephala subalpina]|uniref:Related to fusarubin cluster-esterase n=1 Tax=Phialocephala subalpina TaxID=576137 RepID=A0A1L7WFX2_9HELO|nr:related to fusarubin cluster-esterase [Phialocephala subalpina]
MKGLKLGFVFCLLLQTFCFLSLLRLASSSEAQHIRNYFYVGGQYIYDGKGGHVVQDQMYVEELTPAAGCTKPYPLVFIHGIGQTGTNWLNKPDGGQGWASYFLNLGYTIYLIDQTSRARSPWLPPPLNNVTSLSTITAEVIEQRFTNPESHNLWPQASLHTQWPGGPGKGIMGNEAFDAYYASNAPTVFAAVPQQTAMQAAGKALLGRLKRPVILIGHSQGGAIPWIWADSHPEFVHSIIVLEPAGPPFIEPTLNGKTPARAWGMTDIPITWSPPVTNVSTDFVKTTIFSNSSSIEDCTLQVKNNTTKPRQMVNFKDIRVLVVTAQASWHAMYDWCTVKFLRQAGVGTDHAVLGDLGVEGNGHMMFLEMNSDVIASVLRRWIEKREVGVWAGEGRL